MGGNGGIPPNILRSMDQEREREREREGGGEWNTGSKVKR
jgi:hypothetical protein